MFFKKYFYPISIAIVIIFLTIFFWSNIKSGSGIPLDILLEKDPTFSSNIKSHNILFSDIVLQFFPYRELYSSSGIFSFWDPYSLGGLPFFEDTQARQLDITNLIGLVLHLTTTQFFLLSELFLMLFGFLSMLLFLRALKISRISSFFASVVFIFSSPILIWIHYPLGVSMIWLPFLLLCIENIYNKKIWFYPIFSLSVCFLFFSGQPQVAVLNIIFCFFYILYKFFKSKEKKALIFATIFLFLGISMSSIQMIPSYDFIKNSEVYSIGRGLNHSGFFKDEILNFGKNVKLFFSRAINRSILVASPNFFGDSINRNYNYPENPVLNNYFETSSNVSIIGLLFALFAVFFTNFRKNIFWIFSAIISFCIFANLPFINIVSALPVINKINLSRLTGIFVLSVCVLGATGLDYFTSLLKNKNIFKKSKLFLYIIIVIIILGAFLSQYLLFSSLNKTNNNTQIKNFKNNAIDFLKIDNNYRFVGVGEEGLFGKSPILPNISTAYSIRDIRGYFTITPKRFLSISSNYLTRKGNHFLLDDIYSENFLNIYGVKYLVCEKKVCDKKLSKYKTEKDFEEYKILINENALPISYVAFNYSYYRNLDDVKKILNNNDNNISKNILVNGNGEKQSSDLGIERVNFVYQKDKYIYDFDISENGVLVLSDNYHSGWRVFVNEEEKDVLEVFGSIKGVFVNKGHNHVVFKYKPRFFDLGLIISIISLIFVVFISFVLIRKNKRTNL